MKSNEITFPNESLIEVIKDVFKKNASFRFKVKGFSMSPFIKDGDIVTISPFKANRIILGRAVAFINPISKKLAIHRIIGGNNGCFIMKGDAIDEPDGFITKENILGCVTKIERNSRNVALGLGPERLLIAFLSKHRLLGVIYLSLRSVIGRIKNPPLQVITGKLPACRRHGSYNRKSEIPKSLL